MYELAANCDVWWRLLVYSVAWKRDFVPKCLEYISLKSLLLYILTKKTHTHTHTHTHTLYLFFNENLTML